MADFEFREIVPSSRDLLQVLATRKRSLALLALLGTERVEEEAARLLDLNVSAFAFGEPGPAMQLAARATKTVPTLSLAPTSDREAFLRARFHGADGVCIPIAADTPLDDWDRLAKGARTTRMLPFALALDEAAVEAAGKAGARVVLLRAATAGELLALAARAPRTMTLVGEVPGASLVELRTLAGKLDAAVIPAAAHQDRGFAEFVSFVDP